MEPLILLGFHRLLEFGLQANEFGILPTIIRGELLALCIVTLIGWHRDRGGDFRR